MKCKGESFLLESGEICVSIPNSVIEKSEHIWESFIIAQFHGKAPSPGDLHAITNGIWSSKLRNITVSKLLKKAFLIKIPCPITWQKVIVQGMWHIDNQSMFVAKWKPGLQPEIPELTSVPVWLDFHNVPPQFYSEEGLEHIVGALGDPLFLHPATANMTKLEVARVFTIIDPSKPLPEAINVRFDSGHVERVEVSSPWLPPTCEHCKGVGHNIKSWPTAPITCPTCQSSGHKLEDCPRSKTSETSKGEEEKKKKKKKKKAKHPKPSTEQASKEDTSEGNIVIDIGLDAIGDITSNEKETVVANPAEEQDSDVESQLSADSEPVENSSEEEQEKSSSDEEGESSESLSSDDSGFSQVTSKKTRKQQKKKERQAAMALKPQREKELSRSKRSKSRNL